MTEDTALNEIASYSQPSEEAVRAMQKRIKRLTKEIREKHKPAEPKYQRSYEPPVYKVVVGEKRKDV